MGALSPHRLAIIAIVAVIAYLALTPLLYLVWGTFFDEKGFTLRLFARAYEERGLGELSVNSIKFAAGSSVLAVTVGTPLAFLLARGDLALKTFLFAATLVPLIVPGVLNTVAWIFLLAPRTGVANQLLLSIGAGPAVFDIFSIWGMTFVEGIHLIPLVILMMVAAFRSMDPALEESALLSGARLTRVFRSITLPAVAPAVFACLLIVFVRGMQAFEVPAMLGIPDGTWVFTSRIWRALNSYPRDLGAAGAYSIPLLLVTCLGVILNLRFATRHRGSQVITGRAFNPHRLRLGKWRKPLTGIVLAYVLITTFVPLAILVYASTQPFFSTPSVEGLGRMTLDNFRFIFDQGQTLRALGNSLLLGTSAGAIVMMLMSVAAWLVVRTGTRWRWLLENIAFLPIAVPGLVLGVSLLFLYLRHPVPVYGTLWILLIAYVTALLPYGMRYATTSMQQIGSELEDSARISGATWWQTFRRVVLPLLMPGVIAGWIYILIASMRELSASILVYSPGNEVVPVRIWALWNDGDTTELAALGVFLVIVLSALVALAYKAGGRLGIRPG